MTNPNNNEQLWLELIDKHSSRSPTPSSNDSKSEENDYKSPSNQPLLSISKFVNNHMLLQNYRNSTPFYNYYEFTHNKNYQSLEMELLQNTSYSFTQLEYNIILEHAKYLSSTNMNLSTKYKAKRNAGENENIIINDSISIEHIICLLIYIHFPFYVHSFQASFSDIIQHERDFSHFGRILYGCIEYFGEAMPNNMKVYHALGTEKPKMFDFFNSAFLTQPLSCTSNLENFVKQACEQRNTSNVGTDDENIFNHFIILELQAQFVGDFNDTRFLDISDLSSYENEDEILFWGEWAELSITDIIIIDQESKKALHLYTKWMKGMKYWQKLTSGFADFNVRKFNLGHELNDETQMHMCRMIRKERDVPRYISDLYAFYVESKIGSAYHKMYTEQLDIDFGKIVKKAFKHMNEETRLLLFNDDVSDIDVEKMRLIFVNGKKYRNTFQKTCSF